MSSSLSLARRAAMRCRRDHFQFNSLSTSLSSLSSSSSSSTSAKNKVDDVLERFTRLSADEKRDVFRSLLGTGDASGFDAAEMDKRERKMFATFDSDGDERLTQQEFQNFHRAFLWKRVQEQEQNAQKVNVEKKNEAEMDRTGNEVVTVSQLRSVAASQMYPFIGFGFLDNALMLAFGESIEASVGVTLGLSTMAAAAIGNTLSDVCGVGLANKIEYWCAKFGLTDEVKMTKIQAKQMRVVVARLGGAMTGVTIGCVAGSFPLLFH